MTHQLTEADISRVLARFYYRVRADEQLGPVFQVVEDWNEHLTRLSEFWSSMMLTTGRYKGNPLSMHLVHAEKIQPAMFIRWLELWHQATDELLPTQTAREMQAKAKTIAARFSLMICGEKLIADAVPQPPTAPTPYRISSLFDETTLPRALLGPHALKAGTWGIVRVEEGQVRYREDGISSPRLLEPGTPAIIPPEISHNLELAGPVKLRVEFYDRRPVEIYQH